ncbi:unnamed protein product [Effrenium voratum]|uniref:Uncharacterized protein n=1 Tax=Effrenium voratum TaxID=2562239 RepID=A0AA36MZX4_9DINO|nr:unnamed protein product [Effrenium voratum]CAJ1431183.1 unnamed protein product [Effrenium voratum]
MGFRCSRKKTPLSRHATYLQNEAQAEAATSFPMFTVRLEDALQMSRVEPHERLKEKGLLVEFKESLGKAVFVSHQWAEKDHPDPTSAQFRVFQDAMKNILSGRLDRIELDNFTEIVSPETKPLRTQELRSVKLFMWYDYFSCPQHSKGSESDLAKAIASIHAYVAKCSFFCALCPFLEDPVTAKVLSFSSWAERGWCRLERTICELSEGSWIVIKGVDRLELVVGSQSLSSPICEGEFAVASDKLGFGPVLFAALRRRMRQALSRHDFVTYRVVRSLQSVYLRGLATELEMDDVPGFVPSCNEDSASTVERFLYQNGFWNLHEVDSAGFLPLHYAALGGQPELVKAMLDQRADPRKTARKGQPLLKTPPGVSALGLALLCGHNDAASLLIEAKANCQQRGVISPALHLAAYSNNVQGMRLLFQAGCDPTSELDAFGSRTTYPACDAGSLAALEELIRRGEPLSLLLHVCAVSSACSSPLTRRLIDLKADIDEQWKQFMTLPARLFVRLQSLRYRFGTDTALTRQCYHFNGSTPLMLALLSGNFEIAMILLREGARLDLRNAQNFSALDLAYGAPDPLQEILRGDSIYNRI